MRCSAPRLLIAATASGAGKTTVVCGLLRALQRRGVRVQACKCGPDYIDPQFHREVIGVPSRNLDLFLAGEDVVRELVAQGAKESDLTLIEGAMGYYDGIAQSSDSSSFDLARATQTPAVLVVDARGRALSAAAEVAGFLHFREPSHIAGIILNRVSASYFAQLKAMIEREAHVPVLGYVPWVDVAELECRHLGLVGAHEVADLAAKVDALADELEKTVDLDVLLAVAQHAEPLSFEPRALPAPCEAQPVVAVARDEAFSFYYEDSLALLERLGAHIAYFSPLHDDALPPRVCGLYLGGGYPELHAEALSRNASMLVQVREAVSSGMPTIAECGGFLYLHQILEDTEGRAWPMVGAVSGRVYPLGRLARFGYVTLTAQEDGLLASAGQRVRAHEFHYWESSEPGAGFRAQKPQSGREWDCVISTPTLYAGFPHLYLGGCSRAAKRFVDACAAYDATRGTGAGHDARVAYGATRGTGAADGATRGACATDGAARGAC